MRLVDLPSPNFGPRRGGIRPDMLVLHYTGMRSAEDALDRLCDEEAQVSAHYVIDEEGTVYRLVREDKRAWHAGRGCWRGETDINSRSIGIELVNPGHEFGYRPFPIAQMASLILLAGELVREYAIPPLHVLAHSDVAPDRKEDPGELFDWPSLAAAGIGAWPQPNGQDMASWSNAEIRELLGRVGYGTAWEKPDGTAWDGTAWDGAAAKTLLAFQRHWRPARLTGQPDTETVARLRALVREYCPANGTTVSA
ncbi:N-acetylmuramoyl-L-alanine amidase [Aerophototrophica crusticola]|uniref:N-acetylmuramoyl-L-alanine amidase n=1 Tax=Aerophototrophica crusticola TaxID=1709002 RepID=A0A858R4L0_9PROT|nr:N-acetylmuramoyl-L-alanine amidase [Rhodospirillaceae bacterium B3]